MDHIEKRGSSSAQLSKGLRRSYDANFKLAVVKYAEQTNNSQAAKVYNTTEVNVRRWRRDKEKLENAHSTRKAFRGPKTGRQQEIERRVVDFVREKRKDGIPITREIIRLKALEVAAQIKIPRNIFKASIGWVARMMRRNGLVLRRRTTLAQRLPQHYEEKLTAFQKYVINLRKKHNYILSQMGNADETPVFFDMPTSVTVNDKGSKSVLVKTTGNEKLRITVMLSVLADGTKLPPYVILKRKTMPKEELPKGIIFRCHTNGWMTNELMVDWVKCVWNRRPGVLLKLRGMLVLDAMRGHLTDPVKTEIQKSNCDLVIIPGGMTSQLQVLDVVVNKPFKDHLRKEYNDWLLAGNHPLSPTGKIKKPSISMLGNWVKSSWDAISKESIIKGFKKCCISNAMDGSEDGCLWEMEEQDGNNDEEKEDHEDDDDYDDDDDDESED